MDITQKLFKASVNILFTLKYQTNPLMVVHSCKLVSNRSTNFFIINITCTQKVAQCDLNSLRGGLILFIRQQQEVSNKVCTLKNLLLRS